MTSDSSTSQPSGLEIALQWAQLPPEHLEVALKALDPELARQHEWRLEEARLKSLEAKDRRVHQLYFVGLIAGFVLAVGMLTAAVIVGVNGSPWLAAMLSGPSVLSLAGLFVLRRVDSDSARQIARAQSSALSAAYQAQVPGAAPAAPSNSTGGGPPL
ncbi:hypothetical protein [Streptomyces sp. MUSC 14]|uniref:hypothetical protein n=1 Tax=Streptomyces sp. MUSC 14 TaxID=1354889 RepID=UPI001160A4DD|nr:hypothetical protein [Streptomyces sp. MUSC 14]